LTSTFSVLDTNPKQESDIAPLASTRDGSSRGPYQTNTLGSCRLGEASTNMQPKTAESPTKSDRILEENGPNEIILRQLHMWRTIQTSLTVAIHAGSRDWFPDRKRSLSRTSECRLKGRKAKSRYLDQDQSYYSLLPRETWCISEKTKPAILVYALSELRLPTVRTMWPATTACSPRSLLRSPMFPV
jgi:hypothetical protein